MSSALSVAPEGSSTPPQSARASDMVDTTLVVRAQAGDDDALTALAAQIGPIASRFAGRFLHDEIRGEDVAQVAMMKAFSRLGDVRTPASFPAWLMRIVRNECLNEIGRQRNAQVPLSVLADEGLQIQAPAGGDDDPEEALLRTQLAELVRRVAATLPPHHRQALVMRALEDRSYEEISAELDVPVSVVRVWYFRARQRFRKAFVEMVVARRGVPERCREMGEAIASLIEGTLAADELTPVRAHVDACGFCAQTEDELRATAFRTPARAWLIGLGLLRFGWRLPRRLRDSAVHAPAAAVKVAVAGAGSAVLATAVVGAGSPGPSSPAVVVGAGAGTVVSALSASSAAASPSRVPGAAGAVATPGVVVAVPTSVPLQVLPGLPSVGGVVGGVVNGVVRPLASPLAGVVQHVVGSLATPAATPGAHLP